jgi:predicted DNA binding CopG/RHH family protein
MSSESTEIKDIEEIAQQAHLGADVSEHFTGHFQAKQQINIALPLELLRSIDAECQLQNISRQDWIKMVCAEKIREVQSGRTSKAV